MCIEIERKWLFNGNIEDIITKYPYVVNYIQDFYFNDYTRLRCIDEHKYIITIKTDGTLQRGEFEFEINNPNIFIPYTLNKYRYYIMYNNEQFEINVFKNIKDSKNKDLVIVELEYDDVPFTSCLPQWLGMEITQDKRYYGYNLFKTLSNK